MHLFVLIPFALILWWPEIRPFPHLLLVERPEFTLAIVLGQIGLIGVIGSAISYYGLRTMDRDPGGTGRAQFAHHIAATILRSGAVLTFAVDLFVTRWPEWVRAIPGIPDGWGIDELIILLPFFTTVLVALLTLYPVDARLRRTLVQHRVWEGGPVGPHWTLRSYLNFHVRHQLLVVAVPMILITIVHDLTRPALPWLAYSIMTLAGAVIFVIAPLMLRLIWSTDPLPSGPLRSRLENLGRRIGLRYRDILVWRSEGMMVNAAVMGLFPQVRYVLLSDGLLDSMTDAQVEAVFGHEAGHIRHRHITFFVLFAILGTLIISGVMELLLRMAERRVIQLSLDEISVIGFFCMVIVWGLGFGWVSRRFEAQADLYGAQCVSPSMDEQCARPCSVHRLPVLPPLPLGEGQGEGRSTTDAGFATPPPLHIEKAGVRADLPPLPLGEGRGEGRITTVTRRQATSSRPTSVLLCSTGAEIFRSSLERVAILNGIPLRERSWRHSSIAYRLHALSHLSGDPHQAHRFTGLIRRVKMFLLTGCTLGLIILIAYVTWHPAYRAELEAPLKWLGL